jgi:hypothetical protein
MDSRPPSVGADLHDYRLCGYAAISRERDAQSGAYATGVLVLMTSAAVAVTLSVWRGTHPIKGVCFALITLVFVYTTLVNVIERPDGLKIGAFFIAAIVLSSLVSRLWRTTELRVEKITLDNESQRFINEMDAQGELQPTPPV